jgi:hypothetical protein
VRHAFATDARGVLLIEVRAAEGAMETHRLIRPRD